MSGNAEMIICRGDFIKEFYCIAIVKYPSLNIWQLKSRFATLYIVPDVLKFLGDVLLVEHIP